MSDLVSICRPPTARDHALQIAGLLGDDLRERGNARLKAIVTAGQAISSAARVVGRTARAVLGVRHHEFSCVVDFEWDRFRGVTPVPTRITLLAV
jgi:hypothetical protein